MARQLRLEFEGALYHMTAWGNEQPRSKLRGIKRPSDDFPLSCHPRMF